MEVDKPVKRKGPVRTAQDELAEIAAREASAKAMSGDKGDYRKPSQSGFTDSDSHQVADVPAGGEEPHLSFPDWQSSPSSHGSPFPAEMQTHTQSQIQGENPRNPTKSSRILWPLWQK